MSDGNISQINPIFLFKSNPFLYVSLAIELDVAWFIDSTKRSTEYWFGNDTKTLNFKTLPQRGEAVWTDYVAGGDTVGWTSTGKGAGVWREDSFSFLQTNGVVTIQFIFGNIQVISFGPLPRETNMCRHYSNRLDSNKGKQQKWLKCLLVDFALFVC